MAKKKIKRVTSRHAHSHKRKKGFNLIALVAGIFSCIAVVFLLHSISVKQNTEVLGRKTTTTLKSFGVAQTGNSSIDELILSILKESEEDTKLLDNDTSIFIVGNDTSEFSSLTK